LWSTGHDPRFWSDPGQFNPDRFLTYIHESPLSGIRNSRYSIETSRLQHINSYFSTVIREEDYCVRDELATRVQPIDKTAVNTQSCDVTTDHIHLTKEQPNGVILNRKLASFCCPFGAGRRRCVGESLGRLQVFLFFAILMKSCRVEMLSPPGEQHHNLAMLESFGDVVRPKPFNIRVLKREKSS